MNYKIANVEALYPRINKTYKFDSGENRSVPCDPLDDGAAYEMSFKMNETQAKALMTAMALQCTRRSVTRSGLRSSQCLLRKTMTVCISVRRNLKGRTVKTLPTNLSSTMRRTKS